MGPSRAGALPIHGEGAASTRPGAQRSAQGAEAAGRGQGSLWQDGLDTGRSGWLRITPGTKVCRTRIPSLRSSMCVKPRAAPHLLPEADTWPIRSQRSGSEWRGADIRCPCFCWGTAGALEQLPLKRGAAALWCELFRGTERVCSQGSGQPCTHPQCPGAVPTPPASGQQRRVAGTPREANTGPQLGRGRWLGHSHR